MFDMNNPMVANIINSMGGLQQFTMRVQQIQQQMTQASGQTPQQFVQQFIQRNNISISQEQLNNAIQQTNILTGRG